MQLAGGEATTRWESRLRSFVTQTCKKEFIKNKGRFIQSQTCYFKTIVQIGEGLWKSGLQHGKSLN
jgi:hypothetical protein